MSNDPPRRAALAVAMSAGALAMVAPARAHERPESAHDAIRNLCARFADCAVRRDLEGFGALWAEDGVWLIGEPHRAEARGREAIVTMLGRLLGPWRLFVQMPHAGVVRVDGDRARARWIVQEVGRAADARPYDNYAFYDDDLVFAAGAWRFLQRRYVYLWLDERSPIPGDAIDLPTDLERL